MSDFIISILSMFTFGNVTFVLSLIGSIGTISHWFINYRNNKVNFDIILRGYRIVGDNDGLLLYLSISNNSHLPVSINNIYLEFNSIQIQCSQVPRLVLENTRRTNGVIKSHNEYYSMSLPISLSQLLGCSGYVYFPLGQQDCIDASIPLTVVFSANRSKNIRKILQLDKADLLK